MHPEVRRGRPPVRPVVGVAAVAALVAGCTVPGTTPDDGRPVALTTFTVLADVTRVVAGDRVRVESLLEPGAEVHGYEPTPGDLRRAAEADLVLDNGLGLEAWSAQLLEDVDAPRVVLSDGVTTVDVAGEAAAGPPNPHAWMSPVEMRVYVANVAEALTDLDPEGAATFAANAEAYDAELQRLHDRTLEQLAAVPPEQRVLVTCEGAFSYLARDVGLEEQYLWAVNAEQQATPRRVAAVTDLVAERGVPAVFCESTVSDEAMQQVAAATGAAFGGTLYVDSLSAPDGPVPTYLELVQHDVDLVVAGLTGAAG